MTGIPASDIESYGIREFPNIFASCSLARDGKIIIFRKEGNPEFEHSIRLAFPDIELRFEKARFSRAEIDAIIERIRNDLPELRSSGARIVAYGQQPGGAGAFVATLNVEVTQRLVSARYGETVAVKASGGLFPG